LEFGKSEQTGYVGEGMNALCPERQLLQDLYNKRHSRVSSAFPGDSRAF
jgi:hypothetical protein